MEKTHYKNFAPGGSIKRQVVNPDLLEERNKLAFDVSDVEKLLFVPEIHEKFKLVAQKVREHPELLPTHHYYDMTREEQMKEEFLKLQRQMAIDPDYYSYSQQAGTYSPQFIYPGQHPLLLHYGMFVPALQKLGTDEQFKFWEEKVRKMRILGCYAQTELGHGSNISGLETTATLDLETDEFVIHSPTVTSTKYWPGGLGLWANYALVFARCQIEGNNFGIAPFVVPIRDMETHEALPGVKVGDIGPKLGYHTTDNGFLMFNQVRIPRTNMLARFSYIDKEGTFEIRGNPKALYLTMVEIRY